jgi:signal transduction histidine kinase
VTTPSQRAYPSAEALPHVGDALLEHFDRAPIGLLLLGQDRKVLRANETLTNLTGISSSVLSESTLRRFLSSDAPYDLEDRIFEEVAQSGHWLGELEIRTSIGDTAPMMVSIAPVGGDSSGEVRYVATVIELGQQRWIEAESSRRAAELAAFSSIAVATGSSADPKEMLHAAARAIVEQLQVDACWIHRYEAEASLVTLVAEASYLSSSVRLSSRMIPDSINPGVLRAIETREQIAESELLDRSIATVVHVPLLARDEVVGVISILSVEGEKLSARNSDLLRAVSYQVGTTIHNIRLLESLGVHEKELEGKNAELELFVEELMNADRLKNEFLANTSHELRTPLNSIIGFLNLVLDGLCENEEEQKELLGHALRSGQHLLSLINDVLDLSRIEAGRLQLELREVSLAPLLRDIGTTLAVQAHEKNIDLRFASVPETLKVSADEARLRQIFMNIVGNAIKFTAKGQVVVSIDAPAGSPFVDVAVKDTGIGVGADRRERLFKKFSQADTSTTRKFGGSGLGLVIVKQLIEMMGGSIRLESPGLNQGTLVTITIARAGGAGAQLLT